MTSITQTLDASLRHPSGFFYQVTVETGMAGRCRLNVDCIREKDDKSIDLTPSECKALGHMFLGISALLEAGCDDDA